MDRRRSDPIDNVSDAAKVKAPAPKLSGELRFDHPTRATVATDFGHLIHRTPLGVLFPASEDDVAATIRWAAATDRPFTPKGRSHSVFGRSAVAGGIVCDMSALDGVVDLQPDRITVGAGASWRDVVAATLPVGQTPPVLPEYLDLSVGGTLVVGGIGGTTSRYGAQSDNVLQLKVVTGHGSKITCSPNENSDMFDAVRAGLGQVGVITQATLRLVAAPSRVHHIQLFYADLAAMVNDQRVLTAESRFDSLQGAIVPGPDGGWTFRLDAAKYECDGSPEDTSLLRDLSDDSSKRQQRTLGYFDFINRFADLEEVLRANGQWLLPHPWLTTFVGDSHVEAVVAEELDRTTASDLGPFGQIVLSAVRPHAVKCPLLRLPSDDLCFAFNFIRVPNTDSADEANRMVDANKAIYERIRDAGGTLYPVSALPMTRLEWQRHFGSAFARLEDAKNRFDPQNTLTPGYEIF